ncbi:MAG: DUF222 domain-containing protein [Actinomycetota bacterium]
MFASIKKALELLEFAVGQLDPGRLGRDASVQMFECFAKIERLGAAGKAMCGLRVAESNAWFDTGERSPAHWMASVAGTSIGRAVAVLNTAAAVTRLPATQEAFRQGKLSERQVEEIAAASLLDQEAESELLELAKQQNLDSLRRRCERVRAAARSEPERHEYLYRRRQLRQWIDLEGAFRLEGRFTPESGAVIWAALTPFKQKAATRNKYSKDKESEAAYAADALLAMAKSSCANSNNDSTLSCGPQAVVHVRVDYEALKRGRVMPGEICEVPGVGSIPVAAAEAFAADAFLKAVVTEGQDVRSIAHLGRTIPERLRTAVMARGPECVVPGCCQTQDLELDHIQPVVRRGPTSLNNLARLCRWHHYLKTYHRYVLGRVNGRWVWYEPGGPPPKEDGQQPELVTAATAGPQDATADT